jgi:hypothetical protein
LGIALMCMADAMPLLAWTGAAPVAMTAQDSLDCHVGVDANGRIHAVWRERTNGSNFQIWYAENTGGPFTNPPQQISQGGVNQAHSPAIALGGTEVHVAPACADARLDGDSDVDGADMDIFIGCMTVPNEYALPECGE